MNRHTLYGCRIAIHQITQSKTRTQTEVIYYHNLCHSPHLAINAER